MPISPDELVRQFGLAVESRNAALFVGAGLSTDAGIPGWGGLLADLRAKADVPSSLEDMPLVAQYIVTALPGGRATLEAAILESIVEASNTPSEGHETIARMPLEEIWTTNYDRLLETAMPDARLIVAEDDLLDRGTHASRRLIKMHGSVNAAGSGWARLPVITRGDYEGYQNVNPRMWSALQATYLTRSTLFLGFSFSDPNVDILLRLSRTMPHSAEGEHFTVLRRPQDSDKQKLHDHRVRDLENSGVAVCEVEQYDELIPILRALERRTRQRCLFVSGNFDANDAETKLTARRIGSELATSDLSIVSLAGAAATELSFAMGEALMAFDAYEPHRLQYYFREKKDTPAPIMHKRIGTAIYSALEQLELRRLVIQKARAALVISGGSGTETEIKMSLEFSLPVIPLATAGGAAKAWWSTNDPGTANLPTDATALRDWNLLDSKDVDIAVRAARRLIDRATYLDDPGSVGAS